MAETAAKPVPQSAPAAAGPKTGHLTLDRVLADLVTDKLVAKEDADKLLHERRHNRSEQHPLVVISEQKYKDPRHPKKLLTLDALAEWLAGKVGMPYLHIDPFKIDFAAVTKLMSTAYAQRFRILPVGVNSREATIATCEPFVNDWEDNLRQVLRLDIKRVIANPLDIQNYIVEFFNLAKSVKFASEKDKGAYSSIGNFELPTMFAALVVLAFIGVILFWILDVIERLVIPWHASQRQDVIVAA